MASQIQREVAHRRRVIQVVVLGAQGIDAGKGLGEQLVLHLQLNLVHPQLMNEAQLVHARIRLVPGLLTGQALPGFAAQLSFCCRVKVHLRILLRMFYPVSSGMTSARQRIDCAHGFCRALPQIEK